MRGRRHSSYPLKLLMTVMAVTALYVLSEANISYSGVNPRTLVFSDIAMRASSLALYPLVCFFIKSLADDSPVPLPAYLLLLPSFLIGTSTALIYAIMGLDSRRKSIRKNVFIAVSVYRSVRLTFHLHFMV